MKARLIVLIGLAFFSPVTGAIGDQGIDFADYYFPESGKSVTLDYLDSDGKVSETTITSVKRIENKIIKTIEYEKFPNFSGEERYETRPDGIYLIESTARQIKKNGQKIGPRNVRKGQWIEYKRSKYSVIDVGVSHQTDIGKLSPCIRLGYQEGAARGHEVHCKGYGLVFYVLSSEFKGVVKRDFIKVRGSK